MTYKVPVCNRADYTIYLQELQGICWAHCDVRKWSAHTAKSLKADADRVVEMQGRPILAMNEPAGDKKHQKFLRLMGFHFFTSVPAKGGGECLIFRRG